MRSAAALASPLLTDFDTHRPQNVIAAVLRCACGRSDGEL